MSYEQKVFHFQYPLNSIDINKITDENLVKCKEIYDVCENWKIKNSALKYTTIYSHHNYKTVKKMFELYYPEYLI